MNNNKERSSGNDRTTLKTQREIVGLMTVFLILGGYGLLAALPITAVGCFVGPQILLAGLAHFSLGCMALLIRIGLGKRSRIAWWFGLAFTLLVIVVLTYALSKIATDVASNREEILGASIVPTAVLFLLF